MTCTVVKTLINSENGVHCSIPRLQYLMLSIRKPKKTSIRPQNVGHKMNGTNGTMYEDSFLDFEGLVL